MKSVSLFVYAVKFKFSSSRPQAMPPLKGEVARLCRDGGVRLLGEGAFPLRRGRGRRKE
jgi:hypothetical protein